MDLEKKVKVVILMSTYNGEKFLKKQIESILNQKDVSVHIIVRDDGSVDDTQKILNMYKKKRLLNWYTGENKKTARSFLDLIDKAPKADYYAFSDQDDVWLSTKLITAIKKLKKFDDSPALYAGNYKLVDEKLKELISMNIHKTTTKFNEAIVYSCCTGCTMVINNKLMENIKGKYPKYIFMHDDWIHKVCLGIGGNVIYDDSKNLLYRQHGNNVEGGKHGLIDKVMKVYNDKKNNKHIMQKQLLEILRLYKHQLTSDNYLLARYAIDKSKGNFLDRLQLAFNKKYKIKESKKLNHEFQIALILNYW